MTKLDSTDFGLMIDVKTSDENIIVWDRSRIVKALIRETKIDPDLAETISLEVEDMVKTTKIKAISTPLIRELVNTKLIEHGLEKLRAKHSRLGIPLYDVNELITQQNKENANIPHNPEATNLMLAGNIKKEFALNSVFPKKVSDAHIKGDLHLHDLDFVDRPYCSGQNLEYVKKFGLNLPNALSIAKPAKHAEVLIAHMLKFSAALQGHFAGAIGWDAVNIFLAPYLVGKKYKEIKQLAQILIFEFSQQAVARGGQAIFSDLNLYWEIPDHFKNVEAIGPEGKYTGYPYGAYLKESQTFIKALFEVYLEGDGSGRPFFFPKPNLHITEKFFKTHGHEEFLELVCEVSSKMGNPYFIFDRGSTVKISECCFHPSQKVLIKGEFGIRHDNISKICNEYNYKNKPINVFYKGEFKEASPIRIEHSNFIKIILENGYELITTDNHICLTNNGEKEAKNLNINDYLPCNNISYKKTEKFNITPSNAISYFMGYFLGSFLGDGCLKYYNNTITFSLSKPKQKVIENVIFFAKHFTDNIHINKQNEKNVIFVHITSSILKQFIKEYIKGNSSLKKQLTNKIYNMNYIFQKAFLDGFYDTDGGNNKRTYTFSEKLVKDINALYTLLGVPINITKDTRGKKEGKLSNNVGYVIRPYEQQSKYKERPFFKYFNNQYWFKIKSIEKINYKKPIYSYCFQMEDKKTPYFTLANGIETHNCRMSRKMSTEDLKTEPWKMRFSALQNITINLPRIAYKAKGSNQKLIEQLDKMLELAVKGHIAKKNFIEKILKLKDKGPLALLAMNRDGEPYLIMDKLTYLVGMVGLNEMMKAHYGKELHETDGTLLKGLQIIAHMKQKLEQYSKEYGMHFVLEQTPAESTSYRFAKLDAKDFSEKAVLNGNLESGEIYYTNSTHLNIGEDIDIISRIEKEGRFHPLIEAGSMSHIWLGEHRPPAAALANLVKKIFKHSTSEQVTFSGDFTSCLECFKTSNGLLEECSYCGSKKIDWITRITGYFSKVSGWNAGKKQELLDRKRNNIK